MATSIMTEEIKKLVGITFGPYIFKVDETAIQRYADAIGDPNPLFNDIGYAKRSKFGALICPPGFYGWDITKKWDPLALSAILAKAGAPPALLDFGTEFEFFAPIKAGDTLAVTVRIADIREKEGKTGMMLVSMIEFSMINQDGALVEKMRMNIVNR